MRRSISAKLITIFIATIFISFSISGMSLFFFLNKYISRDTVQNLKVYADKINEAFNLLWENSDNLFYQRYLQETIEVCGYVSRANIWIVDREGYIVDELSSIPENTSFAITAKGLRLPDPRQYKRLFSDPPGIIIEQGSFYGLFKNTGWSWLTFAKPLEYASAGNKLPPDYAVFFNIPVAQVNKTRSDVLRFFFISIMVSVPISTVIVYFFSRHLVKPLKEMKNAAKIIAAGEFRQKLEVNSSDEIGELAVSFNQMITALKNLEEMRRGFIANVSHELRTPMTSIRGFIEGILDGTIPPEKHREYLTIVRDEVNRLNRLVNNLLDLARMEAGELKLNLRNFSINELIRRCIIKLENMILEKELNIEAEFDEEEILVRADPDAIERVLINLLHNAIKFTPPKGLITVSTEKQKDRVLISVKDTGIGIDPADLELIWERFYKTDRSRSRDKSGTGLGLSIVRNIILEHKSEIKVESEPGKGTKFSFYLPAATSRNIETQS